MANLKDKREELHQAQKEMLTTLKDASKEERKEIIEQFKEDNKAKHQEIKETAKALKKKFVSRWKPRLHEPLISN